ncbi:MAG: hypothetical protein K2K70_01815, partial [Lachnospiraceae bacterium]|nr:hypothetical protein [Lachnospiraceae bacterium]
AVTCSSGIETLTGQEPVSKAKASEQKQTEQLPAEQLPEDSETELSTLQYADNYEEAFDRYIQSFTDAVNTGDIQDLNQVLLEGSDVYRQQCAIVQNYHKRGIREEIQTYSISSAIKRAADLVSIDSDEEILVHYSDDTSKVVRQKYRYTCEYVDQGWIVTDMREIK